MNVLVRMLLKMKKSKCVVDVNKLYYDIVTPTTTCSSTQELLEGLKFTQKLHMMVVFPYKYTEYIWFF